MAWHFHTTVLCVFQMICVHRNGTGNSKSRGTCSHAHTESYHVLHCIGSVRFPLLAHQRRNIFRVSFPSPTSHIIRKIGVSFVLRTHWKRLNSYACCLFLRLTYFRYFALSLALLHNSMENSFYPVFCRGGPIYSFVFVSGEYEEKWRKKEREREFCMKHFDWFFVRVHRSLNGIFLFFHLNIDCFDIYSIKIN